MSPSFLPLIELCDNFRLSHNYPFSSDLVPFCLSADRRSVVGLLRPEVVTALQEDNELSLRDARNPSWVFISNKCDSDTEDAHPESVHLAYFAPHLSSSNLRSEAIMSMCLRWRDNGKFAGVIAGRLWRSELYPAYINPFGPHTPENLAFEVERAASSLFGIVTYGSHLTIYEPPLPGSGEELKIWVPTRSKTKQTWPGYLDNSVAGGIPSGMSAFDVIVKESEEEASLSEEVVRKHARTVGMISYFFQKASGWLQPEVEYVYDLEIPNTVTPEELEKFRPKPFDGEVETFELLPLSEVISRMHQKLFKPNTALVLIDFLIRHGYVTPENEPHFVEIVTRMHGRFEYDRW